MILKRLLYALGLIFLLVVFSENCSGPAGNDIIPEKKFISILADIHLADGIGIINVNNNDTFAFDSAALYGAVLEKHGVTRAQFDSTMLYYTARPGAFTELYNQVMNRLKEMEVEVTREMAADSIQEEPYE
jgi:hypothetical protein